MFISRVFSFSENIAKQNKNRLPILELVLTTILGIIMIILIAITCASNFGVILGIFLVIYFGLIIYLSVILGLQMRSRMTGYALDSNGRIFKAVVLNYGCGLYLGGVTAGSLVDQLTDSTSNFGTSLGGAVGAFAQFSSMNKSAKIMAHPEIVAKIVQSAPNITGTMVYEILKVYQVLDKGRYFQIICDYVNLINNKILYQKKLKIEKSYIAYQDLINILNMKK
jgi:hypothetical protein